MIWYKAKNIIIEMMEGKGQMSPNFIQGNYLKLTKYLPTRVSTREWAEQQYGNENN